MFDNLREPADSNPFDSTPFYEEEDQFRESEPTRAKSSRKARAKRAAAPASSGRFLGMLPWQRFVLAFMLFLTVCVLAATLLVVTGKIGLM